MPAMNGKKGEKITERQKKSRSKVCGVLHLHLSIFGAPDIAMLSICQFLRPAKIFSFFCQRQSFSFLLH